MSECTISKGGCQESRYYVIVCSPFHDGSDPFMEDQSLLLFFMYIFFLRKKSRGLPSCQFHFHSAYYISTYSEPHVWGTHCVRLVAWLIRQAIYRCVQPFKHGLLVSRVTGSIPHSDQKSSAVWFDGPISDGHPSLGMIISLSMTLYILP